jgi:hypothetical protein
MQVRRCCLKAGDHEVHEPSDADTNRTANPLEGDFLQEQAFHQGALVRVNTRFSGCSTNCQPQSLH